MIQDDARTHATSFGPSVTPHPTNTALNPLPNPLSRIRYHRTKVVSDATLNATTQAVHTSSTPPRPRVVSRPTAVSEPGPPLATHDASSVLTSNTGHTSTIFAGMQSVGDMTAVLPQPISTISPPRAVVRISQVKDDPRLPEPLADMAAGALVSASSRDGADLRIVPTHATLLDTPSPSLSIQVSRNAVPANSLTSSVSWSDHIPSGTRSLPTNNSTTTLPQRQQSLAAPLVLATTPDFSQPLRGTISFPEDTGGSERSRTHPAHLPTV
ncbi:hypothetical protein H4582DRAFT_1921956 [Lactarius indigo]|nr:hypothetical protein H4582DRAFT_1921956 [Lactarius indigo]